jgi:signal transduction histidine kinase
MLTSGIVVVLTCGAFLANEVVSFRQAMVRQTKTLAQVIASNSTAALAFDNKGDATNVLAALAAEPHIISAALYDRDGVLFATYPASAPGTRFPAAPEQEGHRFGPDDLVLFERVIYQRRQLGTLYMQSDLGAVYERFTNYGVIALGIALLTSGVAWLLSARLQRHISRPILALADTARVISERRDYSLRAERFGDDELGRLTDAFNSMLSHVEEQDAALRAQGDQLREEVQHRTQAEGAVRALNADLERRVAERTEALAAANRELEAFSYSVSHDLRAPLRHVIGFVELLQRETAGRISERGERHMQTIRKAGASMGQLIDDLLAFSRMSRTEMQSVDVPLDALIGDTVHDLEASLRDRRIHWEIQPLPVVRGDKAMLKQVFVNLIENSVKYTSRREVANITIGHLESDSRLAVIFVRDDGAGFDMRYAQKLFGVFQRLHRAEEFEGTGIGLATVQRIVGRHGGRVWAESVVDQGATFYVELATAETMTATAAKGRA